MRRFKTLAAGGLIATMAAAGLAVAHADTSSTTPSPTTPIKHVVVIFDENVSFDHYFGTYPNASNADPDEPTFTARPNTPSVNGLSSALLTSNPNTANPQRLARSQAVTCDQNHAYSNEQSAFDHGLMDMFVQDTGGGTCADKSIVMDYYDGNTVTGLWNLAQNFSMSDNSYSTQFGPSTPGAINLISGQTHGVTTGDVSGAVQDGTFIGDADPSTALDDCANGSTEMPARAPISSTNTALAPTNIGDMLSDHHVTWGWFQGGFRPTSTVNGRAVCGATHVNVAGASSADYSPHHEPFEYYPSTANIHHTAPASAAAIGHDDPTGTPVDQKVNHQYDLTDFDTALSTDNLPAVSFLKAPEFEDGHAGYSDPLDEQRFIASTVDAVEASPDWSSTAIVIAYDDSDGWYDHQMSTIINPSDTAADTLSGTRECGTVKTTTPPAYTGRCGYGPRQPLLVISPYAKTNYVDHSTTDQTSIMRFVEDNWQLGRLGNQSMDARAGSLGNMFDFSSSRRAPAVFLNPTTGQVEAAPAGSGTTTTPTTTDTTPTTTDTTPTTTATTPPPPPHGGGGRGSGGNGGGRGSGGSRGGSGPRKPDIKVTCTTTRHGNKITVTCKVTGKDAKSGSTALRFRIVRGSKVLATNRTLVKKGHAASVLKTNKTLHGKYTLRISIAHTGSAVASAASTIRLH